MIYSCKFSKVNALGKSWSGTYSQEQACLKFSQAEGNIKPILVSPHFAYLQEI